MNAEEEKTDLMVLYKLKIKGISTSSCKLSKVPVFIHCHAKEMFITKCVRYLIL